MEARDKKFFLIFWGLVGSAAALAWILAVILPTTSEGTIERFIMVALAASLAVFLKVY